MPGIHSERALHDEIICELVAHGWAVGEGSKKAGKYDVKRALYLEDTVAWLSIDKPLEYAKVKSLHNGSADARLLDRLAKFVEQRGAIDVLRNGFSDVSAKFDMCAFTPNSGLNASELKRSKNVILRVIPELQYSAQNENRLDLAFFVNGIPVATAELKTDNTQSIDDAVKQYRYDRNPKNEPLLTWKRGAIVHFAISSNLVMMTTKLDGPKTYFLPFNRGNHGGAGNPPTEGIDYLWHDILNRSAWLEILKSFICVERKTTKDVSGRSEVKEILLFPRYHQWDAVTKLVEAARTGGPGNRYLVQHSAGSGKSNSIMWLAHRLSHLHDDRDKKIFDSVFVLTDRTILDNQLADTVQQFDHQKGTIARIDDKGDPKSSQLAKALEEQAPIIIVTLQTFPFVAKTLEEESKWKGRTFAIIADEAHSSQSGNAAKRVREILGITEQEGEIGSDDAMAAQMAARADHKNISYFAFTATPKAKTLELFGRENAEGRPEPFHLYTMRQAIEEGFILDVLLNYTTYEMAYKIATADGKDYDVPKGEAAKLIARMAKLHAYTIAQKVAIIVEHFRETVGPLLSGHGKAMIVTDSREAAVRYKKQIDKYITEKRYSDLRTLVAFSDKVKIDDDFPGEWTEGNMNHLKGEGIVEAFDGDGYQLLIVAEKFQTGFDQPKLCGMYVDKRIGGIAAVQTLSRLNRTYNGSLGVKDTTYILDFVNDADEIEKAFQPYYETTMLEEATDPNKVHDLIHEIDAYAMPGLYVGGDIETFAQAYFEEEQSKQAKQTRLNKLILPVRDRFIERRDNARQANDTFSIDEGNLFRKRIITFGRYYRFLSQLYNFGDAMIGRREVFYEYLFRNIREVETGQKVDISGVGLTHLKLTKTFEDKIKLNKGGISFIGTANDAGTTVARIKAYSPLSEIIALMNVFFGTNISDENQISLIAGVVGKAIELPDIVTQANNNKTFDKFVLGDAPRVFDNLLNETIYETKEKNSDNARQIQQIAEILQDDERRSRFVDALMSGAYKTIRDQAPIGAET